MVLHREPEPTIRAGQMQCISLKLVQESRTLIMEDAEFVRAVDDECETGASNGLVFRIKVWKGRSIRDVDIYGRPFF